ncbi:MAG: adenylate kinase [Fimbriimonadaceae bacterium]
MDFPPPGKRITIRGLSGSGKTTLGRQLSQILDIPHVEMDELFWKPNWTHSNDEEFFPKLEGIIKTESWILCGNYSRSRHIIDPRADTVIWLDYPFWFTMSRLVRRCIIRGAKKEMLWGHCQESFRTAFIGKDAIVWWIVRYRKRMKINMTNLFNNPESGKVYIRFRSPTETKLWLSSLTVRIGKMWV